MSKIKSQGRFLRPLFFLTWPLTIINMFLFLDNYLEAHVGNYGKAT